jgi:hypothetical protein
LRRGLCSLGFHLQNSVTLVDGFVEQVLQ